MSISVSSARASMAFCCLSILTLSAGTSVKLGAAVLADIAEREITDVHTMNDPRARDAQDVGGLVRAELLVLSKHGDALALKQMPQCSLDQARGLWPAAY